MENVKFINLTDYYLSVLKILSNNHVTLHTRHGELLRSAESDCLPLRTNMNWMV